MRRALSSARSARGRREPYRHRTRRGKTLDSSPQLLPLPPRDRPAGPSQGTNPCASRRRSEPCLLVVPRCGRQKKLGRVWKRETVCGERFDCRARCQLCFSRSARCAAEKRAHHLGTPDARRNAVEARRTIIPRGTKDLRLAVTSAQLRRDAVPGRARVSHAGRPRDFRSFARRHRCYHLSWVASAPSVDRSAREEVRACAETRARALSRDARERSNGRSRAETRSPPVRSRAGWDAAASPLASTDIRRDAADARVRGAGRASGARVRDAGGAAGRHRLHNRRASSELSLIHI